MESDGAGSAHGDWSFTPPSAKRESLPRPLFDDDFVAQAKFTEFSAAERATRPRSRTRGRLRWKVTTLLVALLAAMVIVDGRNPYVHGPTLALIAVELDDVAVSDNLMGAFDHEAALAIGWLGSTTGRTLRVDPTPTRKMDLRMSAEELLGDSEDATGIVLDALRARSDVNPGAVPVVLVPAATTTVPGPLSPCGLGGPNGVVIFLGNCDVQPSTTSAWPSRASRLVAHELGDALGAVGECAPNHTDGHVGDDPADLMAPVGPATLGSVTLDTDRRDYLGHDNPGCPDILDSPLWADRS